jgi:hypothetical protein
MGGQTGHQVEQEWRVGRTWQPIPEATMVVVVGSTLLQGRQQTNQNRHSVPHVPKHAFRQALAASCPSCPGLGHVLGEPKEVVAIVRI